MTALAVADVATWCCDRCPAGSADPVRFDVADQLAAEHAEDFHTAAGRRRRQEQLELERWTSERETAAEFARQEARKDAAARAAAERRRARADLLARRLDAEIRVCWCGELYLPAPWANVPHTRHAAVQAAA